MEMSAKQPEMALTGWHGTVTRAAQEQREKAISGSTVNLSGLLRRSEGQLEGKPFLSRSVCILALAPVFGRL